jgi:uncharacterized protein (TIGR01244 family)
MQIHQLTDQLSVADQISPDDFAGLAAAGFRSIVNNRPDGEGEHQPANAVLAAAAERHGLAYRYLPVISGQLSDRDANDFADALRHMPAPVLAFCRTGTRSSSLWALQADGSVDTILATARAAGYDLSALQSHLSTPGRR